MIIVLGSHKYYTLECHKIYALLAFVVKAITYSPSSSNHPQLLEMVATYLITY